MHKYYIKLRIIPHILEKIININSIIKFSLIFLFCLNKINKPSPEPDNKPAIQLPNGIISLIYNSVITTLDAQFGIKPMILEIIGLNILLLFTNVVIISLSIIKLSITFIIKINDKIFKV